MALTLYWYDSFCFAIVGISFLGALWVLWKKEGGGKCADGTMYESLLVSRPDNAAYVRVTSSSHLSSAQLWSTCWRGLHPIWLLASRFISFGIMAACLVLDVIDWDPSVFVYYTEWTFALVMVYFAIGTVISAHGCWIYANKPPAENGESGEFGKRDLESSDPSTNYRAKDHTGTIKLQSHYDREESQQRAGFWGYFMQALYQTCAGAVILTDIVFWCIIVPFMSTAHLGLNTLMGCMHSLNLFFLLIDTTLNSLPFPWFRMVYFVLWSCLYTVFQWVIHACGFSWWPYPFLDLSVEWAPLWYFAVAVLHLPCYGLFALIMKTKISFFSRLCPHSFVRSY